MEVTEKYYNIHDVVTFKIVSKNNFSNELFSNIDLEYKIFESGKITDPDFIVYIGNFTPSNHDSYILDNKYYIKEDYFYCKDSRKLAKWAIEMSRFEGGSIKTHIHINLFGLMSFPNKVIDFLIRFKMNEKGFPIVHASCVSKDNHAVLFTSRGGGGKTTTALHFLEKGFDFLGDDFIIIHESKALSFLSPLNIFTYNLTPVIKKNLGYKDEIKLYLKNLLYKATSSYFKIFTKVDVGKLFSTQLLDESELDTVFLLIPKERVNVERIDKEELINHIVINQKLDFSPFLSYMLAYSYMFPNSNMATHWDSYKENLRKNLGGNISFYKVEVPWKYDVKVLERIFEVVQNVHKS